MREGYSVKINANLPTFASVARARGSSQLKRSNCSNFQTKDSIKRIKVLELLKSVSYPVAKLVGIADMKFRSINIICETRQYVLELEEKLKSVTSIYNLRLYESKNINVMLGWVPIPLTNEEIKLEIEKKVEKVVKVSAKKHEDGLLSGIRIVTIPKISLEQNPLPSYVSIHGNELYVTYTGQMVTCRYCEEAEHVPSNCEKRKQDFPQLKNQQTSIL